MKGVYAAAVVLAMLFVSQVFAANLWYDNFNDNKLDPKYIVKYDPQEAGNGAKLPRQTYHHLGRHQIQALILSLSVAKI
ncbi:hypothetical protein J7M22_14360 [Candidatus Poribacteria bacterium]|nr:hypothetical protein [Candidatus Poribacteria bacterium]